jgi:hypothetical protein
MSATFAADCEKYKYKPFQVEGREEDELLLDGFNPETSQDIWRVRLFKRNTLLMFADLPSEELCELWIKDLHDQNYDFDDYDIKQGTLMEGGGRWW